MLPLRLSSALTAEALPQLLPATPHLSSCRAQPKASLLGEATPPILTPDPLLLASDFLPS